jgi:hypothetical protein
MPPLKSLTQFWAEANTLARADDLAGLIGLCNYLIAHWREYPMTEYNLMLDHPRAIALARRRQIETPWQLWFN